MNENRDPSVSILQCHVKIHSLLFRELKLIVLIVNTTETEPISIKGFLICDLKSIDQIRYLI